MGIARVADYDTLVVAYLPGLIEGAAEGAGLGHQFLRHVERCRVLLHLVDLAAEEGRRVESEGQLGTFTGCLNQPGLKRSQTERPADSKAHECRIGQPVELRG